MNHLELSNYIKFGMIHAHKKTLFLNIRTYQFIEI
jgi:hypothetical protein